MTLAEERVIATLNPVRASASGRASQPSVWMPVLSKLFEILEAVDPARGAENIPVLDKAFWLVLVTEGVQLLSG